MPSRAGLSWRLGVATTMRAVGDLAECLLCVVSSVAELEGPREHAARLGDGTDSSRGRSVLWEPADA